MKRKVIIKSNLTDISNFAKMIPTRLAHFENGSSAPIPKEYAVNKLAKLIHPEILHLTVKDIVPRGESAKSFILVSSDDTPLAPFIAGQYLTVKLSIGDSCVTRPYSLASTPNDARNGFYNITVKRTSEGFVSDYILDNLKIGDKIDAYPPEGTFTYEPIRDAETIVGVAGGSGITPFLSIAGSIADGTTDAKMILLYGAKNEEEILFRDELDTLSKNENISVVYVLSDSKKKGYEHGFIGAELISKYAPEKYSLFICGPKAMYEFVGKEVEKLGLRHKFVRFELFPSGSDADKIKGFPKDMANLKFNITVKKDGKETVIPCISNESILVAFERAGIDAPARCRSGVCGFCRSKLISGKVYIPEDTDGRRIADIKFGYIHPCSTYPLSDLKVKIN
ncbi:MAG: 2Fe-2S iron-sulfur cluster binding domain-containing protein [Clostridiales bacterium]|nr:2Fe-2S iron-sulfur cluster binding domain-containing protein [Clostridiales bacterium]